jgi:hypothetical protein
MVRAFEKLNFHLKVKGNAYVLTFKDEPDDVQTFK